MNAYLVSHNGLGDNLFMVGSINYLKHFYKQLFFLCKRKYYNNIVLFFSNETNITCIPFDENIESNEIKRILTEKYSDINNDILVCGSHKKNIKTRINNQIFLNHTLIDKNYTIDYQSITNPVYSFIEGFYKDINLNLTYFYEYFSLPEYPETKELYSNVSNYYIIFIQYKSSCGRKLNISNLIKKYLNDNNAILICNDINLYPENHIKHDIAKNYVYKNIVYYVDVIKNADEIYIIDSCFIGLLLPFIKTNQLKTKNVNIVLRQDVNKITF